LPGRFDRIDRMNRITGIILQILFVLSEIDDCFNGGRAQAPDDET
jgi:hypothetical protein